MQEMQEIRVRSLGQEDPSEKEMATHSSILAWEIAWTEKPGGLKSMGSQRMDTIEQLSTPPQSVIISITKSRKIAYHFFFFLEGNSTFIFFPFFFLFFKILFYF